MRGGGGEGIINFWMSGHRLGHPCGASFWLNCLICWKNDLIFDFGLKLQWATKVLRHFVIFEYLRQISFLISTILPPPPFSMLNFLSLEFASLLYNIEKGGGGLALNINRT